MPERGEVWLDELRAVDNRRLLGRPLCRAPERLMRQVGDAIRDVLDLVD